MLFITSLLFYYIQNIIILVIKKKSNNLKTLFLITKINKLIIFEFTFITHPKILKDALTLLIHDASFAWSRLLSRP